MKKIIKKILPENMVLAYHYILAEAAAFLYGHPSRKMVIIGITGTKGKTSAANFLWAVLSGAGKKTGMISSANIRIGETEEVNKYHMTMPGRFTIQKSLKKMAEAGCQFAIVETTSEGIKQYRHKGIDYDILIFTNLSPEHLPSHGGSYEKYREAKGKLFSELIKTKRKKLDGKEIPKVFIVNSESDFADYFLSFPADKKITYGMGRGDITGKVLKSDFFGVDFESGGEKCHYNILGAFNIINILPALAVAKIFDISAEAANKGLESLRCIPGRMEIIDEGQNFLLIVDYAHEGKSMAVALGAAKEAAGGKKVIVVLGAEGGGRDKAKRPQMGEIAARLADFVVVANVDPYDDDPKEIIEDIARAAEKAGKTRGKDLFAIEDREKAIKKAISLAQEGDVVLITGKGAEQSITLYGKKLPWDDREISRKLLTK